MRSVQKTAHALRHFTMCGGLWAVYSPNATPAAAIFSGFALSMMGLSETQVAFLVSLAGFVGLWELFAFYVGRSLGSNRLLLVGMGTVEITAASLIVFVPGLASHRFVAVAALLAISYLIGHTISPTFNSWLSNVMPEEVRGRYIGRRMFAVSVTTMLYLYAASTWLDWRGKTYFSFAMVFLVGWICGILGYLILLVTPYPRLQEEEQKSFFGSLLLPLRNRPFAILTLYLLTWTIASSMSGAFFGVYMINRLHLPYSTIAIYTNIALAMMMAGYLAVGSMAQRYGSKPLAQLLIFPGALVPAMWAFATRDTHMYVMPVASLINGFCIAGLGISASNLLYKILPKGESNSVYFGTWTAAASVGAAVGPLIGGILKGWLPETVAMGSWQFSNLQVVFLIAAAAHIVPAVLSALLVEGEASSPRHLLGQFRGNLPYMAYSWALWTVARKDQTRGEAMRRLGQSRSPLAVEALVKGLDHMSHEVRSGAAKGLGEGRFHEGVEPLVQELVDKESDIRPEAAEALGKIGAAEQHLFEALHDEDVRVRQSAAMGLSELQTDAAREALLEVLRADYDRNLFPTLVEAIARVEDLRLVEPALAGLAQLTAPVIRMQVINGICRVLGEKNHFYRLATATELAEGRMREKMMARVRRLLARPRYGTREQRTRLRELGVALDRALDEDDLPSFAASARELAGLTEAIEVMPERARYAAYALNTYLQQDRPEGSERELIVFVVICLTSLARCLGE
ncbi:MAG: MFS transporter [Armatimonadia bacterium]